MNAGEVIAGMGLALTGLVVVGGCVGWVVKNWLANQLAPLKEHQAEIAADVREIKREVLPNGGASLSDRVVRIEAKIDGQDRREFQ